MIDRNTTIPTKKTQTYSTAEDNQNAVTIRVFQGEREMAADNKILGQFDLVGIPPAPRGVPQIEVTFDIDANGIVNVHAKDKGTGKEQQIKIQASGGLSDADIEKMVQEAEQFAEEDKSRREAAEAKNSAESLIHSTEQQLKEHGDKVDDALKTEIEAAVAEAKTAIEGGDTDAIKAKAEALAQVAMKMGQAIYEKEQAGRGLAGRRRARGAKRPGPPRKRSSTPNSPKSTKTIRAKRMERPLLSGRWQEGAGVALRGVAGIVMVETDYYDCCRSSGRPTPARSSPPIASSRWNAIRTAMAAAPMPRPSSRRSAKPMSA